MSANQETLASKGGDEAFVTKLRDTVTAAGDLNKEQEKLKAMLRETTARLNEKMKELQRLVWEARNYVKMALSQERWVEFGITAKR